MMSPLSVNWTTLTTLRATPGPSITIPPATLLAITQATNLKPAVVRPALEELVREGCVREYQTQYGKSYARTQQGDQRIREVREWLR
ncbi:hypothetical protein [Azospirillum sp.]|uniref:hypothetical protein n=1 Tax=Azospirillum sp. TaxID=34012 RepID=UPI003D70E7E7